MFGWFKKQTAQRSELEQLQQRAILTLRHQLHDLQASYYEATEQRGDLWTLANGTDADAALRSDIRRQHREHYRYEKANNPVVNRIQNVYVDDMMGESGPQLQLKTGNTEIDRHIEGRWSDWWKHSRQASKMNTSALAQNGDGEAIAKKRSNYRLAMFSPVQLDVRLFECDRLASPNVDELRSDYVDGVYLDMDAEPVGYDLLKQHPGNQYLDGVSGIYEAYTYTASEILHVFRQLRPEQHRGLTNWAPALPAMGEFRKFLRATRKASEIAAVLSVMLETNLGMGEARESITLPDGAGQMMTLPDQWKANQMKAEHPSTTLEMFFKVTVSHGSGCFSMPVERAMGWAINGSYAAIRGQLLPYANRIKADRCQVWEPLWLNPLYVDFVRELTLSDPFFAPIDINDLRKLRLYNNEWLWPKAEVVVDPSREATSTMKRYAMGEISREQMVNSRDIDGHDQRAAVLAGFDDSKDGVKAYRQQCFINAGKSLETVDQTFEMTEQAA